MHENLSQMMGLPGATCIGFMDMGGGTIRIPRAPRPNKYYPKGASNGENHRPQANIGKRRNMPCQCGSGKKTKKCCGQ